MGDVQIRQLGQPGDLGWVVAAHGELYTREFGWDSSFEVMVARLVADFGAGHDPARERGWIAELDGRRVGCVLCARDDEPGTAKLRVLLVHPDARGHGLGTRLVDTCTAFAREAGYEQVHLWTTDVLTTAVRIYVAAGFRLVAQAPHHGFGVDLVGQDYMLDLRTS